MEADSRRFCFLLWALLAVHDGLLLAAYKVQTLM